MRTEFLALVLAIAFGLGATCGSGRDARRPDGLDVSAYPPEMQDAYQVFAYHCSRCHSLARPLTAQVDDVEHWRQYVERMRRQPGSGISRADGVVIVGFLAYWMEHREQARETFDRPAPATPDPEPAPDPEPEPR